MAAQPADTQDAWYQIEFGFTDVGIDEIVPVRGGPCAAGNDAGFGERGNPRPLVPRRGDRAWPARSRDWNGARPRPLGTAHGRGAENARPQAAQQGRGTGAADAGEPFALYLGAGSARRRDHAGQRSPRQLQRELQLFRPADLAVIARSVSDE